MPKRTKENKEMVKFAFATPLQVRDSLKILAIRKKTTVQALANEALEVFLKQSEQEAA